MKDHYNTLGLKKTATEDEIKKAYRKLAMEHHPDRHQGESEKAAAELKFKAVKEAYEILSDAKKRNQYDNGGDSGFEEGLNPRHFHGTDADQMFAHLRAMHEHARRNAVPNIHLRINIEKAFTGAKIALNVFGKSISYSLRAGMPQGVSFVDEVPVDDTYRRIQVQLEIISNEFRFMHVGSTDGIFFSGDVETDIEVDALDIMLGNWIIVTDFLGKQLQVRVPAGFDLAHRLKVAGHGYSNWRGDAPGNRGDMYLRVIPKFKPIKDLDAKKIEELYNLTKTK